jgi:hypothetical protein
MVCEQKYMNIRRRPPIIELAAPLHISKMLIAILQGELWKQIDQHAEYFRDSKTSRLDSDKIGAKC